MAAITLTPQLARAAATDAGNRSMRRAGRTAWSIEDYNAAVQALEAYEARREAREATVRHTSCRHCGLDIEGMKPFNRTTWRDRGNNTHCPNGAQHAPVKD